MSDDQQEKHDNPVLSGLVALLAVSLAVGLILGGVALVGTRVLGIGGESSGSSAASGDESAIIPPPSKTVANGPQVTLATETPEESEDAATDLETEPSETKSTKASKAITLQAGQTAVGNFERIDLTGIYPGGEGAILQVQRLEAGQWADFDATIPVSNETFTTYVQSAQIGVNKFRVIDNATGDASNTVTVTVG